MMGAYDQLRDLQVPTRKAAALVGVYAHHGLPEACTTYAA